MLTEHFRVFWLGASASIGADNLADWEEDTDFRDRYAECVSGAGAPAVNGGNSQHLHTGNSHGHIGVSHTHDISTGGPDATTSNEHVVTGSTVAGGLHTHAATSCNSTIIAAGSQTTDLSNCSADATRPAAKTAFFIKPKAGIRAYIPDDCVIWLDDTSVPTHYAVCDGGGGTYDLDAKYIIGCPAAAANGDAAVGAANHTHAWPVHGHTFSSHVHSDSNFAACASYGNKGSGSPPKIVAAAAHNHQATNFSSAAGGTLNSNNSAISSDSNEPSYHTLLAIQNTSGSAIAPPDNTVLLYMGSGKLPSGWRDCDGSNGTPDLRGTWVKCTKTGGSVGNTGDGGISNHTHTSAAHTHIHPSSHNHTCSITACADSDQTSDGRGSAATSTHSHGLITVTSTTPTWNTDTATFQNTDGRATYRTARFVKYTHIYRGPAARPTADERAPYVQLRPAVAFVPTIVVPGYNPTEPVYTYHSFRGAPVDENHPDVFQFPIEHPLIAEQDVTITYSCRASLNSIGAYLWSALWGHGGTIRFGEYYSDVFPGEPLIWLGGQTEDPAPECPDDGAEKAFIIPKDEWNDKVAEHSAMVVLIFSFGLLPLECADSFVGVVIEYDTPGEPQEFVYTAPTYLGLRSYAPTHLGCNGKPRYKWAEWAVDPHTCTFRPQVTSMSYWEGQEDGYNMISLGGHNVSPEEMRPHLPGACSTIFPMRGHTRGSVVRIMGVGACHLE